MLRKQLVIFLTLCLCLLHSLSYAPDCFAQAELSTNLSVLDDVYGPNDYPAKATPITVGQEVYGTIAKATDIDFYRFEVESLSTISIQLDSDMADLDLTLFDQELVYLAEGTTPEGQDSITACLQPGTYFVRLYAPDTAKDAFYTLAVNSVQLDLNDANEPNDSIQRATLLEFFGETVAGAVYSPHDVDWFSFEAAKAGIYRIETATDRPLALRIVQNGSSQVFEGIVTQPLPIRLSAGNYAIAVEGLGQPTQYQLRVVYTNSDDTDCYECNDANDPWYSLVELSPTDNEQTIYTNLDCINDVDSFLVTVAQPVKLTVGATGPRDMWIKLYKVNDKNNLKFKYEESIILGAVQDKNSQLELANYVLTKGQYFLEVGGMVSSLNYEVSPDYWLCFTKTNAKKPKPPKQNQLLVQLSCDGVSNWNQTEVRVGWDDYVLILPEEPNTAGELAIEDLEEIFDANQLSKLRIKLRKPGYYVDWQAVPFNESGSAAIAMHLQAGDLNEATPGVDLEDLKLLGSFLGNKHEVADFNGDDIVNIFDLVLAGRNCQPEMNL